MKKYFYIILSAITMALSGDCLAQQSDEIYDKSLTKVLEDVEKYFNVKLQWQDNDVANKDVHYAFWRFTTEVNSTLSNILGPLDMTFENKGDNTYVIHKYDYSKRTEEEGKKHLDQLLASYPNAADLDKRKANLRECIFKALGIDPAAARTPLNPIVRAKRIMDGYTIENVAFESIPGFYVTGNLYRPYKQKGPFPVILSPHGHFYGENGATDGDSSGRFSPNVQFRCAGLAKMGAIVFSYEMYSWGESIVQTGDPSFHRSNMALPMQTWNSIRGLDFLLSLPDADKSRVGVTGASGGGTQTFLVTALDDRITASAPVVMVSSSFFGGCSCESGLPIHGFCNGYRTNNAEIAAMAAPRPQLVVSDGSDWTQSVPGTDYPYLKKVYSLYGKGDDVVNVHLPNDQHDYGYTKRVPMYNFFAKVFGLNLKGISAKDGKIDEHGIVSLKSAELKVFGEKYQLPSTALKGEDAIEKEFRIIHSQAVSLVP